MAQARKSITVWKWRAIDKGTGKWRLLPHRMTAEQAAEWSRANGRRIERVEGSAEERAPILDGWGGGVPPAPDRRGR